MPAMKLSRLFALSGAALVAVGALAISGPIPLAWRFWARTSAAPTASPVVTDDTVIVPIGRRVYALDATSGAMKWMFPPGDEPDGDFTATPGIEGGIALLPNGNRFIYAVKVSDGTRLWSMMETSTVRRIVTHDGIAYLFMTDDRIVAINVQTGAKTWSSDFEMRDGLIGTPVLVDGNLVFFTGRGTLVAVSTVTQKQLWSVGPLSPSFDAQPISYGGYVYIVSGMQVARLNPRNGQPVGRPLVAPERLDGSAAITPKGGVVATSDNKMFLFDVDARQWRGKPIQLKGYLRGTPQAVGENVLIRATNGGVYLIDPSRTENPVIWEYTTLPIPGTTRAAPTATGSGGNLMGGGGTGGGRGGGRGGGAGAGGGGGRGGGGGNLMGGGDTGGGGAAGGTTAAQTTIVDYLTVLGNFAYADGALYALAEDGSVFAWRSDVGVDETGPKIVLMSPPAGTSMNGQPDFDILFRVEDETTGVMARSIRVTMNDQPMNFEYDPGGGYLRVKIRPPGSTTEGANPPLTDGRKVFVVRATDWLGNMSERQFIINIDNTLPKVVERTIDDRRGTSGGGPGVGGGG